LLKLLSFFPHTKKQIGTGIRTTQRNPNKLVAQATPRLWNIAVANNGKPAPAKDRKNVLAAIAEFACIMYTSMM
jgi:hypothetical protein